ncbi:MAG: flagellar protein [Planctomycetota bacterium]|nr:MAG: flagellar protein [Planctomycetota bacterium]
MITLHRLSGEEFFLNAQHIESLDRSPDTRVTLANGKQLYVRETPDEIRKAMLIWHRLIHGPLPSKAADLKGS